MTLSPTDRGGRPAPNGRRRCGVDFRVRFPLQLLMRPITLAPQLHAARQTVDPVPLRGASRQQLHQIFAGYGIRDLPPQTQRRARAKLLGIDATKQLDDLLVPPGNRLEALRGDREGSRARGYGRGPAGA
jgi:hypothetical protein